MKKLVTLLLCLVMVLSLAACKPAESNETPSNTHNTTQNSSPSAGDHASGWNDMSAVEILQKIAEKADIQIKAEITDGTDLYLNALSLGQLEFEEIALYTPMISSQRFEVAVIRVKEGVDVDDYAADLEDRAANAQWICAAPPDFIKVVAVDECVLYMAINSEFANEEAMIEAFQNPAR